MSQSLEEDDSIKLLEKTKDIFNRLIFHKLVSLGLIEYNDIKQAIRNEKTRFKEKINTTLKKVLANGDGEAVH